MPADRNKEQHAVAAALEEARARGLPDRWSVTFDGRRRRKWVSPGPVSRTFDSLPKALAYVEKTGPAGGGGGGKSSTSSSSSSKKRSASHVLAGPKRGTNAAAAATGGGAMGETHRARYPQDDTDDALLADGGGGGGEHGDGDDDDDMDGIDDDREPAPESDAETALDAPAGPIGDDADRAGALDGGAGSGGGGSPRATTVHWDPYSPEGRIVGFRIRLFDDAREEWRPGRVVRYEPNSNRHKIRYDDGRAAEGGAGGREAREEVQWMRLKNEIVQCGSRLVWALVKGFAWWPAQVLVCDPPTPATNKEGYVYVEFFGADQVATIKDTPEFIRPFNNGVTDDVIRKNKKKRNQKAIELAREEQAETQKVRNEAAKFYAEKAFAFANRRAAGYLGRRVEFFRSEINYPAGATVRGVVRQHSPSGKKWLVSYDFHVKLGVKLDPSWVNLTAKECSLKFLDKDKEKGKGKGTNRPTAGGLTPFLFGYSEDAGDGLGASSALSVSTSCSGCAEGFPDDDDGVNLTCGTCCAAFHPGCLDPPMTTRAAERILDDGDCWLCPKCRTCRGCRRLDVGFGSRAVQPRPATLFLPPGEPLELCSACAPLYDQDRYCPDCGHIWDDAKYQRTQRLLRWQHRTKKGKGGSSGRGTGGGRSKKRKQDEVAVAPTVLTGEAADSSQVVAGDGDNFDATTPDTSWYYPESTVYGFNEGAMLICDSCNLWVHAGCAGLTREEYEDTNRGIHPVYSKEFLCRTCCISRCKFLIQALHAEDSMLLFASPVTEQMAPNYRDVIKSPMDLQTMTERAQDGKYHNYAWVRENFELMVSNALTFNSRGTKLWDEARRYYKLCVPKVFDKYGKAAPPGLYHAAVHKAFADAKRAREMEAERVRLDETTEKKDLVAGAHVRAVELSPLATPRGPESCVTVAEVWMSPIDAFYCAWIECCFGCGSCGANDTMLFCVDCGESYHSFCADAPILSMTAWAVGGWRCPNCKICEITGDVPEDENKLLFCEMCDRAFTLTELSPPLKSVPTGLFICGQCVDCKSCGNHGEKGKVSLKYWSRDPSLCFRCGGCKGLVERQTKGMKCAVCKCLWRSDDTDLVPCVKCKRNVHAHCYESTARGRTQYECPHCRKKDDDKLMAKILQNQLHEQARQVLMNSYKIRGSSLDDCHMKLVDEINWQMRSAWIEDYRKIVSDGERLLVIAKEKYGRKLRDLFVFDKKGPQAPVWMVRRASRWIRYKEKRNSLVHTEGKHGTRAVVTKAKMAAAFIQLACWSMGLSMRKTVKCSDRLKSLLVAPSDDIGTSNLPAEKIKLAGSNIIHEHEWTQKYFDEETFYSLLAKENPNEKHGANLSAKRAETVTWVDSTAVCQQTAGPHGQFSVLPSPLMGWGRMDEALQQTHPWKDPRSCCLCGGCGDDDAGVPGTPDQAASIEGAAQLAHAGRLLPMQQGSWVHSSCALWSSEVWENPEDALLVSVDKAKYRGSKLKCFGCGRPGATIGCHKQNCSYNYHFPCARACGAVFTKSQTIYCKNHKSSAQDIITDSFEVMKPLKTAPPEQGSEDVGESSRCYRAGSLVVHSFGNIPQASDGFHSAEYLHPKGYTATRIFWSYSFPRTRTVYFLKIQGVKHRPHESLFSITSADAPKDPITGRTATEAYSNLMQRVEQANSITFSEGDPFSVLPRRRLRGKCVFGINGPHFFGFGLDQVRRVLETLPGIAAVTVPLSPTSQPYNFCFKHPSEEEIKDLQRERAVKAAEKALKNISGCARTEGMCAVARSGGSGRITRALVKRADEDQQHSGGTAAVKGRSNLAEFRGDVDSNIQEKYREMKSVPMDDRLEAKRSHIHGWGLFTKNDLRKHAIVCEYMGETIRQRVADKRERAYETSGVGSCYMFRLDQHRIVDATMIGCMARFMNHCCHPNAYAKVISVNTDQGIEKKIVVFANRKISSGDEITYDYKFPVEDGSLRCTCGAPNCIGRMN